MFFKNKTKYNVTKAYFLVTDGNSINLSSLVDTFLQHSTYEATHFSINYDEIRDIRLFLQEKEALSTEQLENLDFYDASSRPVLTVNKVFSYLELDFSVMEFTSLTSFDEGFEKEIQLFNCDSVAETVTYGYSRVLNGDYLPVTEEKVKKGLFGGTSTSIGSEEAKWLVHPKDIAEGAIKGYYPLNYLNDKGFSVAQQNADILFDSQQRKGNILLVDKQSQQKLSRKPVLKKYTHFSDT